MTNGPSDGTKDHKGLSLCNQDFLLGSPCQGEETTSSVLFSVMISNIYMVAFFPYSQLHTYGISMKGSNEIQDAAYLHHLTLPVALPGIIIFIFVCTDLATLILIHWMQ